MDYGHEKTDTELKFLERKIAREYNKAYKEIKTKADEYFRKFADADQRMLERLNANEITLQEYREWRTKQMLIGARWEALRDDMAEDMVNADKIATAIIDERLPDTYALNMNYGTYEVESGTGINTSFDLYDRSTVERLLSENPEIIPRPRVDIPKDRVWNKKKLTSAITQGVLQGDSIPNIAKRLRGVTDMGRNASIRNARTYTTAAENGGRIDSYKRAEDMGIKLKQEWRATLDSRTRSSHRHLDGEQVDVGEKFSNGLRYPGDPDGAGDEIYNCRCTLVAAIDGYQYKDVRDYSKLGGISYEEWVHEKDIKSKQIAVANSDRKVVNGQNIFDTWQRRPDKFNFEIEDVINAQGFDGLPQVVSEEEFDKSVREARDGKGLIMQRAYSAPDQETLDAYQQQLYNGKWYVDCSVGGANYGQGMYAISNNGTEISAEMKSGMSRYRTTGGNKFSYVETMTMQPNAKIINYSDIDEIVGDYKKQKAIIVMNKEIEKLSEDIRQKVISINGMERGKEKRAAISKLNAESDGAYNKIMDAYTTAYDSAISVENTGSICAAMGYDAIYVERINYMVILNRTKVIIKRS